MGSFRGHMWDIIVILRTFGGLLGSFVGLLFVFYLRWSDLLATSYGIGGLGASPQ